MQGFPDAPSSADFTASAVRDLEREVAKFKETRKAIDYQKCELLLEFIRGSVRTAVTETDVRRAVDLFFAEIGGKASQAATAST